MECVDGSTHGAFAQIRGRGPAALGSGVKVEFAMQNLVILAHQYLQPPSPIATDCQEILSLVATVTATRWCDGGDI